MKRKIVILLLCGIGAGLLLASCGKKEKDPSKDVETEVSPGGGASDAVTDVEPVVDSLGSGEAASSGEDAAEVPDMPADFEMSGIYRVSGVILDDQLFTLDQMVDDLGIDRNLLEMGIRFDEGGKGVSVAEGVEQSIGYQPMEGPKGRYVIISSGSRQEVLELESDGKLYLTYGPDKVESTGVYAESSMILVFDPADSLPDVSDVPAGVMEEEPEPVQAEETDPVVVPEQDDVTIVE